MLAGLTTIRWPSARSAVGVDGVGHRDRGDRAEHELLPDQRGHLPLVVRDDHRHPAGQPAADRRPHPRHHRVRGRDELGQPAGVVRVREHQAGGTDPDHQPAVLPRPAPGRRAVRAAAVVGGGEPAAGAGHEREHQRPLGRRGVGVAQRVVQGDPDRPGAGGLGPAGLVPGFDRVAPGAQRHRRRCRSAAPPAGSGTRSRPGRLRRASPARSCRSSALARAASSVRTARSRAAAARSAASTASGRTAATRGRSESTPCAGIAAVQTPATTSRPSSGPAAHRRPDPRSATRGILGSPGRGRVPVSPGGSRRRTASCRCSRPSPAPRTSTRAPSGCC